MVEHSFQPGVLLFESCQGFVQSVAHFVVQLVAQVRPAGCRGDEKCVLVVALRVRPLLGLLQRAPLGSLLIDDDGATLLEHVRAPLQEQHPEDVLLELGGIHLAAQDVGGPEEVTFELSEGYPPHAVLWRADSLARPDVYWT